MTDATTNDLIEQVDFADADGDSGPASTGAEHPANDGVCSFATPVAQQLDVEDRPVAWQGSVYGLVVHSTPRELGATARRLGVPHTDYAVEQYTKLHGCHYINGWA